MTLKYNYLDVITSMISDVNLLKNNTETALSCKVSRIKIIRTGIISCFREKLKPWTIFDGAAKIISYLLKSTGTKDS